MAETLFVAAFQKLPMDEPLNPARNIGLRRRLSLVLFVVGLLSPPFVFIASGLVAGSSWVRTSDLLDAIVGPLLLLSPVLCFMSPFLLPATPYRRVQLGVAALCALLFVGVVALVFCLFYFGIPIR